MANDNVIAVKIPADELKQATDAINLAKNILDKYLIALTPQERKQKLKMGDKSIPFVEKVIEYTKTNPKFVADFMDVPNLELDFQAVIDLSTLLRPIEQVSSGLNDTILLSGGEALSNALIYYNTVKQASKNNVPDAKTVYEDLKKRFERIKTKAV
jgi:hypothetical protein